jgi:SPP1 family predicted phage head-tail adaptor
MDAGQFDRRITLQRRAKVRDENTGRDTITWPDIATVWANKRDLSGREQLMAQQVAPEAMTRFTIRWRDDITEADRIAYDGQTYDIQHIAGVGRRDSLAILAKRPDAS